MKLRHIILTRLGIGVDQPHFYRLHIDFLANGLFKCMTAQTNQNFEWFICVDHRIDATSLHRLKALLATHAQFHVIMLDPIKKGRLVPKYADLPVSNAGDIIALTRIDDDDLIHRDFVKDAQAFIINTKEDCFSFVYANGIEAHIGRNQYRTVFYPTVALGLTTVSPKDRILEVYGGNHFRIDQQMTEMGLKHHIIRTDEPRWVYAIRPGSDSYDEKKGRPKVLLRLDQAALDTFTACGADVRWPEIMSALLHDHTYAPQDMPAMKRKVHVLAQITQMKRGKPYNTAEFDAQVAAFYAI